MNYIQANNIGTFSLIHDLLCSLSLYSVSEYIYIPILTLSIKVRVSSFAFCVYTSLMHVFNIFLVFPFCNSYSGRQKGSNAPNACVSCVRCTAQCISSTNSGHVTTILMVSLYYKTWYNGNNSNKNNSVWIQSALCWICFLKRNRNCHMTIDAIHRNMRRSSNETYTHVAFASSARLHASHSWQ